MQTISTLFSTLRFLYPTGPELCQVAVVTLLSELTEMGGSVRSAMTDMAKQFPDSLRTSRLKSFIERLGV